MVDEPDVVLVGPLVLVELPVPDEMVVEVSPGFVVPGEGSGPHWAARSLAMWFSHSNSSSTPGRCTNAAAGPSTVRAAAVDILGNRR